MVCCFDINLITISLHKMYVFCGSHREKQTAFLFQTISHSFSMSVCLCKLEQNATACCSLTLKSQLITCCLLYCEIVRWLFNWASVAVPVCYYGLPSVEYYLRNCIEILFFFPHFALAGGKVVFKSLNHIFLSLNHRISLRSSRFLNIAFWHFWYN